MSGSLYVGIDGHKNFSFLCAMTREGEVIEERKVRNEEIEEIIEEFDNPTVVIEPTTATYPSIRKLRKKNGDKTGPPTENQTYSRIQKENR